MIGGLVATFVAGVVAFSIVGGSSVTPPFLPLMIGVAVVVLGILAVLLRRRS